MGRLLSEIFNEDFILAIGDVIFVKNEMHCISNIFYSREGVRFKVEPSDADTASRAHWALFSEIYAGVLPEVISLSRDTQRLNTRLRSRHHYH